MDNVLRKREYILFEIDSLIIDGLNTAFSFLRSGSPENIILFGEVNELLEIHVIKQGVFFVGMLNNMYYTLFYIKYDIHNIDILKERKFRVDYRKFMYILNKQKDIGMCSIFITNDNELFIGDSSNMLPLELSDMDLNVCKNASSFVKIVDPRTYIYDIANHIYKRNNEAYVYLNLYPENKTDQCLMKAFFSFKDEFKSSFEILFCDTVRAIYNHKREIDKENIKIKMPISFCNSKHFLDKPKESCYYKPHMSAFYLCDGNKFSVRLNKYQYCITKYEDSDESELVIRNFEDVYNKREFELGFFCKKINIIDKIKKSLRSASRILVNNKIKLSYSIYQNPLLYVEFSLKDRALMFYIEEEGERVGDGISVHIDSMSVFHAMSNYFNNVKQVRFIYSVKRNLIELSSLPFVDDPGFTIQLNGVNRK